ncbi:hypothetical protein, partial [Klebsiella pneumoniae]|uniref:hypothetical protein n=1 Tax=Klebsiella pneumoniae TaxID=573 RepID=UPI003A4E2782
RITPSVAEQEGQQTETEATGAPQKHHYTLNQQVGSITCHCLLITLLISRLFHCAAKCRIIQQEYDTKTSKMFQSSHKMFQFVNSAELFSPQNGQGNTH